MKKSPDLHNDHFYVVIMAGGTGTRLWPLSRKDRPKQFHKLTSSKTLLQETYDRALKLTKPENVLISTTLQYCDLVLEQLPNLTKKQLIIEPCARGTAPAIALTAQYIFLQDKDAIIATLASDHAIKNISEFISALSTALTTVAKHPDKIATVGINPTFPNTELGYIKIGKEFFNSNTKRVFYIESFKEKPDFTTAEKYMTDWAYLWNAGYFIFHAETLLMLISRYVPNITKAFVPIAKELSKKNPNMKTIEKNYAILENEPLDTAIIEKLPSKERLVVPSELQWSDIGTWSALYDFFKDHHNSSMIVKGNHIDSDSKNCFIHSNGNKMIATLGLEDMIIVETDDAILIANRTKVHNVKKIIEKLKSDGKHLYL